MELCYGTKIDKFVIIFFFLQSNQTKLKLVGDFH